MFLISSISQGPKAGACPRGSVLFFVIDVINDSILLFFFLFRKEFVCLYFHTSVRDCVSFFFTLPKWQKFLLIALNWPIKNTVTDLFFFVTASSRPPKQIWNLIDSLQRLRIF